MRKSKLSVAGAALCVFALPVTAQAQYETIATCGASKGHSYYADRNLARKLDMGWREEPAGKPFALVQNVGGTFDILYPDDKKKHSSYVASGGTLMPIGISENSITIVAVKPEFTTSETYIFHELRKGGAQVIWTRAKAETPLPTVGAFVAACDTLNLSAIEK